MIKYFVLGALCVSSYYLGEYHTKQTYLHNCIPSEIGEKLAETIQYQDGVICVYIHTYGKHYFVKRAT